MRNAGDSLRVRHQKLDVAALVGSFSIINVFQFSCSVRTSFLVCGTSKSGKYGLVLYRGEHEKKGKLFNDIVTDSIPLVLSLQVLPFMVDQKPVPYQRLKRHHHFIMSTVRGLAQSKLSVTWVLPLLTYIKMEGMSAIFSFHWCL